MQKTIVIGIAGPAASGKSLLAHSLVNQLDSSHIVMIPADNYYKDNHHLTLQERAKINYDHPSSIDQELLAKHLETLLAGKSIDMPQYNYITHSRMQETTIIQPRKIIILEGFLTLAMKRVRELMDIKIYVDTPLDICLVRRIKRDVLERGRDVAQILTQYNNAVRPMFLKYIEPSKKYSHIIVPRGGKNRVALDMIKARVKELLKKIGE